MYFIINSIINFLFLDIQNKYNMLWNDRNQLNLFLIFFQRMDEAPKQKQKKELTGNEIIGKLKANDNDVSGGGD